MKKLLFLLPLLAIVLSSCNSTEPKNEITLNRTMSNVITNASTNEISMKGCTYSYTMDLVNNTIKVRILNLRLGTSEDEKSVEIAIPELTMKASSSTGYTFSSTEAIIPVIDGVANPDYTITSFSGVIFDNELKTSYIVNSKYVVKASPLQLNFPYATTIVSGATGDPYTSTGSYYSFEMSTTDKTADLIIGAPKFAQNMPELENMTLKGLKITPTNDGYSFTAESVVPTINGIPYENYKITNITGKFVYNTSKATIFFNCINKDVNITAAQHEEKED